jgi:hypothetical protein
LKILINPEQGGMSELQIRVGVQIVPPPPHVNIALQTVFFLFYLYHPRTTQLGSIQKKYASCITIKEQEILLESAKKQAMLAVNPVDTSPRKMTKYL